MGKETMKTTATRNTGLENATEEKKEDESSYYYISTYAVKGKEKKDVDVNGIDDIDENDNEGTNDITSAIKKKKGKKNIKRWGGGGGKKRRKK